MHALLHIDSASHQYILMHVLQHKVEDKPLETQNKEVKCRHMFADLMVPVQAFSQTSCQSNYLFIVPMHAELSDAVQFCTRSTARCQEVCLTQIELTVHLSIRFYCAFLQRLSKVKHALLLEKKIMMILMTF